MRCGLDQSLFDGSATDFRGPRQARLLVQSAVIDLLKGRAGEARTSGGPANRAMCLKAKPHAVEAFIAVAMGGEKLVDSGSPRYRTRPFRVSTGRQTHSSQPFSLFSNVPAHCLMSGEIAPDLTVIGRPNGSHKRAQTAECGQSIK